MNFVKNFFQRNGRDIGVSAREMAVLSVIDDHKATGICAADLTTAILNETGKEPRLMTIYETLLALEEKGLIYEVGKSVTDRGGRKRRLFTITENGEDAINLGRKILSF